MTEYTLIALIVFGCGTLITFFCVGISQYKSIVLKKEQIKADAMIRAEEIKAKNQLELERLIHSIDSKRTEEHMEFGSDERRVREHQNR